MAAPFIQKQSIVHYPHYETKRHFDMLITDQPVKLRLLFLIFERDLFRPAGKFFGKQLTKQLTFNILGRF